MWWRPSDARCAGSGLAAAEPIQVCGVAGSSPWLVSIPPAVTGFVRASFRFCRVGRGWPTPIHGSGLRVRHDFADCVRTRLLECFFPKARELQCAVCPAKGGVDIVHTYVCFIRGCPAKGGEPRKFRIADEAYGLDCAGERAPRLWSSVRQTVKLALVVQRVRSPPDSDTP